MQVVLLCGPPCSGKTTLAQQVARLTDVVLDYDTIARSMGSPAMWMHPEPYRTAAEQRMQAGLAAAHAADGGTAWVIRTAPRPQQRASLAQRWGARVYLLDPGERECRRRAHTAHRPTGTARSIGEWYHRYRPWVGDLDPIELDARWINVGVPQRGVVQLHPGDV